MKVTELNNWLTLLANLGVLAGIFFVAYEINQNSNMMAAQTRAQISESIVNLMEEDKDPNVVVALLKLGSGENLNETDEYYLLNRSRLYLRTWENSYYQYRKGLYSEEEFQAESVAWQGMLTIPHMRWGFESDRSSYSPEFEEFISSLLP